MQIYHFSQQNIPSTAYSYQLSSVRAYTFSLKKACINKCENCRGLAELAFVLSKN